MVDTPSDETLTDERTLPSAQDEPPELTVSDDAALALAATMAVHSIGETIRGREIASGDPGVFELPSPAFLPSPDAAPEDTAVFYERMLQAQSERPASGAPESYEILGLLGRGGMGEVWRAVQRSLGREVALKQLTTDDPAAAMHFVSEARVTARLAHSNIVPVHALGRTAEGRPMLAMKLVKGTSWQDLLHSPGPRDLTKQLGVFVSVCNAVAFAHAEGFLHRDLKPANVMVADYGQVFLVDWGLAVGLDRKVCDEQGILHVHDVKHPAGTPAYMAPELASGDGAAQGPWTDVYLLGACLHEIATGTAPHAGKDTVAALRHAMESPPPSFGDDVPRELADICRRAMARSPVDRYPDARSLRIAVEAFLAHAAARAITEKGARALGRLKELTASPDAADEAAKMARSQAIHATYTESRFAFEHALESWSGDDQARAGLAEAARVMLKYAIGAEDLAMAQRLAGEVDDAPLRSAVEALRSRLAAREAELSALREQARLLDDRRVARPVGRVFILAGVLGGAAIMPTRFFLDRGSAAAVVPITVLWSATSAITGIYAFIVLRGGKKSLMSGRIGWTWSAVAVGCLAAGAVAIGQGEAPFRNAAYTTMMIAIGFVAQAMQTRKWLLAPAFGTFLGSLAMGFFPSARVEIFGVLWVITLVGVGIALRRGARVDADEQAHSRLM
ncbi:MAG: serine/threonine-protein kinase [Polyangiaceae bacterium]